MNANCAGRCTTACKPVARAGTYQDSTFENIILSANTHAAAEAGLPSRVKRETTYCRSCGCETTADRICPACAEAIREERAAAQTERCRVHRVRYVDDLPVSVLQEMQAEWGRC